MRANWPRSCTRRAAPPAPSARSPTGEDSAMNEAWWIWALAILGSAIGVAGGALGTYFSVRNTKGPRERSFMVRVALACWLLVLAFAAGIVLLPGWYKHLLAVPYVIVLLVGIRWCNRAQARIRKEESGEAM